MSLVSRTRRWMTGRCIRAGLGTLAFVAFDAAVARASDSTEQCLDAYEAGQRQRQTGDLLNAARELRTCGGPACPVRMQGDCQRWLDDVERSTPTVVFRVRDASGELLTNVTVSIDGQPPRRLDGRAVLMNPGEHVVLFARAGYQPLRTPVFVTEGEKLEPRDVMLESSVEAAPNGSGLPGASADGALLAVGGATAEERRSLSVWPLALGALGVVGGTGFVLFGVRAKNGETDLERCSPDCSQAQVDDVKRDYLWSNVSLGVGLGGLIGAGLFLLLDEPARDGASNLPRHALIVGNTTTWVTRF
jgi:hypothetical protein